MPNDTESLCPICRDPARYRVEQLYLDGDLAAVRQVHRYTRSQVEQHMGHLTDPDTLRTVSNLASATSVAARMRQLEQASSAILELAIAQEDGRLALMALREARQTLAEIAKLADALDSQQSTSSQRTDLDDAIADYLGARRVSSEHSPPSASDFGPGGDRPRDVRDTLLIPGLPAPTPRGTRELEAAPDPEPPPPS